MTQSISSSELLALIERIVGDDFCEDLDCHVLLEGSSKTDYEITAQQKLSSVYRIVHCLNKEHSCHHVHKNWRKQTLKGLLEIRDELRRKGKEGQ